MNYSRHFQQLDSLLAEYAWLWQPQPYKQARPPWCDRLPALCAELLALSDDALRLHTEEPASLLALLARHQPGLEALGPLTELPTRPAAPLAQPGPHFGTAIPGRKWQQIGAFSAALQAVQAPLLEWCGGKGHLGRLLAFQWQQPVLTLELDEHLCTAGEQLAEKSGVAQSFVQADALGDGNVAHLAGRHAVALHACGELHRRLVQRAVQQALPALDIAPCCYHLHGEEHYRALTPGARLALSREDRRLAVTETVTAAGREVRLRNREMAWKLGFDLLRRELAGEQGYRPVKPIDKQWLHLGFAGFCRALAEREEVTLEAGVAWADYEVRGWQRQRETMRLSLVRHAFRRAVELWLVLDLANYLERHGYRVELATFCERELTPRNILLSARR